MQISLLNIALTRIGAIGFNPLSLFSAGEQGVWYDPSDFIADWRYNLLTYTEQFSNAAWAKANVTVTANSIAAPNSTNTADLVNTPTAAAAYIYQSITSVVGVIYTASVWLKGITGTEIVRFEAAGANKSVSLTTSWVRYDFTFTATGTTTLWLIESGTAYAPANGAAYYIWGAQLEIGSTARTYQPITDGVQDYYTYQPQPVMFQDAAGTTPVAAVEQPVGLLLDKSKGLVLGSELVVNGDFTTDTDWTKGTNWTISGGKGVGSAVPTGQNLIATNYITTVVGQWYEASWTVSTLSAGQLQLLVFNGAGNYTGAQTAASTGTYKFRFIATSTIAKIYVSATASAFTGTVDDFSIKTLAGNHATQSTSTSRPILSARYNLLTYTEQFDNAAWTKTSVTAVNTTDTTDPFGGNTADKVTCTSTITTAHIRQDVSNVTGYSYSFYAKAGTSNFVCFTTNTSGQYANFNLSTGAVSSAGCTANATLISNGWYRCVITNALSGIYFMILGKDADPAAQPYGNGNWTSGNYIYLYGGQLVVANNLISNTYQRVTTATDYDTDATKFPKYLKFDGVDDSLATASVNFTVTDKMTVWAGWRWLSNTSNSTLVRLGTGFSAAGTFLFWTNTAASTQTYQLYAYGNTQGAVGNISTPVLPRTDVVTGLIDMAQASVTDELKLRLNGASLSTGYTSGDCGTGNFANAAITIGNYSASNYLNGQIYSLIIRGAASTATQITNTETYVNSKTKAY